MPTSEEFGFRGVWPGVEFARARLRTPPTIVATANSRQTTPRGPTTRPSLIGVQVRLAAARADFSDKPDCNRPRRGFLTVVSADLADEGAVWWLLRCYSRCCGPRNWGAVRAAGSDDPLGSSLRRCREELRIEVDAVPSFVWVGPRRADDRHRCDDAPRCGSDGRHRAGHDSRRIRKTL